MFAVREVSLLLAKVAEETNRYDDMVEFVRRIVQLRLQLQPEERSVFTAAFRGALEERRCALVTLREFEEQDEHPFELKEAITEYKEKIASEAETLCKTALRHIKEDLLPVAPQGEHLGNLGKMRGDFYRYLAEFRMMKGSNSATEDGEKSLQAYKDATKECSHLLASHPLRLSIALNSSVLLKDILGRDDEARQHAAVCFDAARRDLASLDKAEFGLANLFLRALRENLAVWTECDEDKSKEPLPSPLLPNVEAYMSPAAVPVDAEVRIVTQGGK
uniref:14-3-3 domain-containing protein n=1 Tax=Chromera velia CCMP2878 TaxID=1169474 RepID=A0A0G4GAF0_9ALVE|eukprot:Cvel_20984.t1-p1 / transcript=Cvel_20984.t1 / gene=Cvel_20984 / organism=Chromera_velia_CCMP2878 / gene_product=14-3-3-like protein D, putative / transcript_product=14-3-3-like protein D, putative / location=Cvel_scaffold1931:12598-17085(-) / protein_length=275 / sequence_SO=supercontig / SO=protein_coding / is_pseudo=false